jgi:hypothetical protein
VASLALCASVLVSVLVSGCKEPRTEVLAGPDARLRITLVNPTTCSYCDPYQAIDHLRVDAYSNGVLVASDEFAFPDETPTLPSLEGFGVVRVEIAGLSAGRVQSGGRTPDIALDPTGGPVSVEMLFAPVNTMLPLPSAMRQERSRHVAMRRNDGDVVLIGGVDGGRDTSFADVEVFDASTWSFAGDTNTLAVGVAGARAVSPGQGQVLLAGGVFVSGGTETAVTGSAFYDGDADTLASAGDMAVARSGHCLAGALDGRAALALGGSSGSNTADLARRDGQTGAWSWSSFTPADFNAGGVIGCAGTGDGRVFVLGSTISNTGIWAWTDDGVADPALSFSPVNAGTAGTVQHVSGAVMLPLDDGRIWIGGGSDASTGEVVAGAQVFSPLSQSFSSATGLQDPRYDGSWTPWYRDGWVVVGCGWQTTARTLDAPSVELLNPTTGEQGPSIPTDRSRNGCAVTSLIDGSVLVSGGYYSTAKSTDDGALVVPWLDEPAGDTGETGL